MIFTLSGNTCSSTIVVDMFFMFAVQFLVSINLNSTRESIKEVYLVSAFRFQILERGHEVSQHTVSHSFNKHLLIWGTKIDQFGNFDSSMNLGILKHRNTSEI